ncbi:excisionase [Peptostreptococcus faecalis]|uniref:excisionase n=1 Tax=Peptostreptococcus faecalis TaxID=2045015 RepID=UPI000C7978FF|nr:excisionase [Peptostreptococcus faecalis]
MKLEELKATKNVLEEVIEKQEQEEFERKGYKEVPQPSRQELNLKTVKEIAEKYSIGQGRLRELARADREVSLNFPVLRIGKKILIPEALFEEWLIEACKTGLKL